MSEFRPRQHAPFRLHHHALSQSEPQVGRARRCGGSAGNRIDEGLLLHVIAEVVPPFPPSSVLDTHHLCAFRGPPLGIR